nr:amino acid ABC transporter substrate-binding protein [Jiangella mangrovi]
MWRVAALAPVLAALVACGLAGPRTSTPPDPADGVRGGFDGVIRFGATVSDTGRYAQEGRDVRRGYDVWLDWVNGEHGGIRVGDRRLRAEIVYYDDESDPGQAAALTERLIVHDGAGFLLGPFSSGLNAAAGAIAERHRTLLVTGNGASDALFDRGSRYFFSVMTVASRYAESVLDVLATRGAETLVVAYQDADFPIDAGEGAAEHARRLGMRVLAVETYPRTLAGVAGIVAKFRDLDPDVLFVGGHFVDGLRFTRAAEEQGFEPEAMILTVAPSNPAFADELGDAAELVIGPTQWEASMRRPGDGAGAPGASFGTGADYAERYSARYGEAPTYHAAGATAAALALQLAIEAAGSTGTDAVRAALLDLDAETFYGPIDFDRRGRNWGKPMGAVQVQDGGLELVTPGAAATAELVYPRSRAGAER